MVFEITSIDEAIGSKPGLVLGFFTDGKRSCISLHDDAAVPGTKKLDLKALPSFLEIRDSMGSLLRKKNEIELNMHPVFIQGENIPLGELEKSLFRALK